MSIGGSIALIAIGAILYWAIDLGRIGPIEVQVVGLILMIAGVIGLLISVLYASVLAPRRRGDRELP